MTTIAFIGSGRIGSALAHRAVLEGYDVVMSNSRHPETLAELVAELGEHASAATPAEAAAAADWAVVTIPLHAIGTVPVEPLAGKTVIDTNNCYPQRDGQIDHLDEKRATSSELLQRHLPASHVVKAFNNIQAAQIISTASPSGTPGRRALSIAGDDAEAKKLVTDFIDGVGFDVVDVGPLAESWRVEPGTPAYGAQLTAAELEGAVASADR